MSKNILWLLTIVCSLVTLGCVREGGRLRITVLSWHPVSAEERGQIADADDGVEPLKFEVAVGSYVRSIEKDAFRGRPLKIVVGGAARIYGVNTAPLRGDASGVGRVVAVENEVRIDPFSLKRNHEFVIEFIVEPEPGLGRRPRVLGVLAEIDSVQVIELAYIWS